MATTINGSTSSSSLWTFKLVVTENSTNITNNTSSVTVDAYIGRPSSANGSYMYGARISCPVSVTGCDKQTISYNNSGQVNIGSGAWLKIGSVTFPSVPHSADGSKTITVSASFTNNIKPSSGSASGTVILTTIPRKSTMSVSNGTLGVAQTLTVTRQSTSFTHTITYECGSYTGTICTKSTSTSVSFTPALDFANGTPNGTSVYVSFSITTYNGNTSLGSNNYSIWCTIPNTMKPSASFTVTDASGLLDRFGAYIQNKSCFIISVTAEGIYGSTISTYKIEANGKTYNDSIATTDILTSSGDMTIKVTVTDSRGRSITLTKNVNVLSYSKPKISNLKIKRSDSNGTSNSSGEYLTVNFDSKISSLNGLNGCNYSIEYKKTKDSDSSYTYISLHDYANKLNLTNGVYTFQADAASSYDVRLTVADNIEQVVILGIGTATSKLFSWLTKGLGFAFGKVAELENTFEVAFESVFYKIVKMKNGLNVTGNVDVSNDLIVQGNIQAGSGVNYVIPVANGDLNTFLNSGKYYIGNNSTNRPENNSGWLEVQNYGNGDYCYQQYVTYTGVKYERWRNAGVWGDWIYIDYVVQRGTSGIWTYEKWQSGKAVCWGRTQVVTANISYAWGNIYAQGELISPKEFPFTFKDVPIVTHQPSTTDGNYWTYTGQPGTTTTHTPSIGVARATSHTITASIDFYVIGKWK